MESEEEPPQGVHHYASVEGVPRDIAKYWHQRHNIFSRYDDGVWLTDDAWFGVTPEPVARRIAEHVASAPPSKSVLIDAFAGAGGNVIAFALSGRWKQIFAIEKDAATLACARHNAALYGVANKIWWIHGDAFDVLPARFRHHQQNAVLFASPPWGGPSYADWHVFDLSLMQPYNLVRLYGTFSAVTSDLVLYLPRTSDLKQLARYVAKDDRIRVVHYCMRGASKALCAYYGSFTLDE